MDKQRGDRPGSDRFADSGRRVQSRWSSGSPTHQPHRYGPRGGDDGLAGGRGGGRYHPYRAQHDFLPPPVGGVGGGFGGAGGGGDGGFRGGDSAGDFAPPMPMGGPRRGFGGRGASPERGDFNRFAKLFIGSVPRTATEEDIRPLFEEHGDVIEVAFIKDRKTGEQQGCCFVKYATSEEADRAIRALHNQYTLPGGLGPIQVRYADGDREHHGAVEDKLFVASLNKQATAKEIEEIFLPYGHVEDVYIMKDPSRQSRGCGFVKFSNREMATAALNALSGKYVMRGCDQPLVVRFADPKRPRPGGESRGGPAFGGPGFSPRSEAALVIRPTANLDEPRNGRKASDAWHPLSPESLGPSSQFNAQGPGSQLPNKGVGSVETSSEISGMFGPTGGSSNGSIPSLSMAPVSLQGFNSLIAPVRPYTSQQISPLQKPLMPYQNFPYLNLPNGQQTPSTSSQIVNVQAPLQQIGQLSGMVGQTSATQTLLQQNASSSAMQTPINLQPQAVSAISNQQPFPLSNAPNQLLQQPMQQFPSHLLLQQQSQTLQSRTQSSQQAIYQLQQHLQLMQQQQMAHAVKPQSTWTGQQSTPVISASTSPSTPASVMVSTTLATPSLLVNTSPAVPLTCNWTEHTSPEGFKYYYNSFTHESKWEKPDEFALYEQQQKLLLFQQQQQQHQKFSVQQLPSASDTHQHALIQPKQEGSQIQQVQLQLQPAGSQIHSLIQPKQEGSQIQQTVRQQAQLQLQPSLMFQASGGIPQQNVQDFNYRQLQAAGSVIDPARIQQGIQAAQELAWKSKPAGS